MAEKLKAEWPGILQWAIDGCLEWQKQGLAPPAAVRTATDEYLADEDSVARWLEECCVTGKHHWGIGNHLWSSWKAWAEPNNERVGTRKGFAQTMISRGFPIAKSQEVRGHQGVDLRPDRDE